MTIGFGEAFLVFFLFLQERRFHALHTAGMCNELDHRSHTPASPSNIMTIQRNDTLRILQTILEGFRRCKLDGIGFLLNSFEVVGLWGNTL